jgi:hypothetical protein
MVFCIGGTSPNIILVIKLRTLNWAGYGSTYGWTGDVRSGFWRKCEDNIKMDLQEVELRAWTVLIWLRVGTGGGLL